MSTESTWDSEDGPRSEAEPVAKSYGEEEAPVSVNDVSAVRPWGLWATLGWTLLCVVVMFAIQTLVFLIFVAVSFASNPHADLNKLVYDGNLFSVASLASTPPVVGLVALLIYVRRYPFRSYLAWIWPPARVASVAVAGQLLILVASDLTSHALGRPISPPIMFAIYRSAWLSLLLLALLVAAPLGEEILFRGFLYKGIAESRLGPIGAVLISSVSWAVLHIQYDWYGIVSIMLMGCYLGWVRSWSRSVPMTIGLHVIVNLGAFAEVVIQELKLV